MSENSKEGRPGPNRPGRSDPEAKRRRARFSVVYVIIALLAVVGLNYLFSSQPGTEVTYSELKEKIAAGEVAKVTIAEKRIVARPTDSAIAAGAPESWTAVRVDDPGFIELIEEQGIEYEGAVPNELGWLLNLIIPFALLLILWMWMLRRVNPAQGVMTFGKSQAKLYAEEGTGVNFGDVAGVDEARQELQEVIEFLKTPEKFARLGATIPKGILLVGPPGTGKTLLARAVAGEAGVPFFNLSGSEFVEMFVGVGAARVRDLFGQAKEKAPCIIFIDELDALAKARGLGGPMGGNDEREQTLNQLLVEMDGFDPRIGVIIMAATNRPELLDPALLRAGRFDRQVLVDRPDMVGREAILMVHARRIRLAPDVDLSIVARRTPGFVGADLANLLNEAALLAARADREAVTMDEIDSAVDRIVAGLEKKNRLINDQEKTIVAYHEAGHAVVAERVEHADPVHKISIIPRGIGALGYTQQLPTEDRYLMTRPELLDRIAVLLGGRVAEEIVFGEISTGAQNDLSRVTDIARSMVMEYGMSDVLGPLSYDSRQRTMLGMLESFDHDRPQHSEETLADIDREVRRIVDEAREKVDEILTRERSALDALAVRLLEKEVIEADELREILAERSPEVLGPGAGVKSGD
ncbi:MAG: ATP-dependent zinc metalloprotease FtsH [Gemmatimonadota bacterium]|nr:ATP-dependent zinc metalloprotease FtsH [Candidatus Palauibacterales bacterium]